MRVLFLLALSLYGQPAPNQLNLDSFEKVWTTIRDKHWEKNPGGLDWQAIHAEFRPRVERAKNIDEVRAILREMLGRLHQTHFGIIPTGIYAAIDDADAAGDGSPGIDLRLLDGQAVVTEVDPGSPAERAGVKPGWVIVNVKGKDLASGIRELAADPTIPELMITRALLARLSGPVGGKAKATFLNGAGAMVALDLDLAPPRGQLSRFGNLPDTYVWFESRRLNEVGYVRFNMFLDLPRVMESFGKAVTDCAHCKGLIIDLRGNPGGIGGMAMGMAGYLVDKPGLRLGSMYTRDATLNFVHQPAPGGLHGAAGHSGGLGFGLDLGDLRGWIEGSGPGASLRHPHGRGGAALGGGAPSEWRRFPIRRRELHFRRRKAARRHRRPTRSGNQTVSRSAAGGSRSGSGRGARVDKEAKDPMNRRFALAVLSAFTIPIFGADARLYLRRQRFWIATLM